ncbi:hypothetical protein O3M35_013306 [Rhynocoris fuscipes]|uniref:Condensin complex subunit 2 n=1 Tax=Rhynocoris fuscipes TaxID=488301 RepID=A0AAW1CER8_9HEMI
MALTKHIIPSSPKNVIDMDVESLLQDNLKDMQKKKGKYSFILPSNNIEVIDDVINDDELERRRRKEEAELLEKEAKEKTRSASSKPIFNLLNDLDPAQLEEHFSQCIRMCTQNKVNSKNAFKLQLIDYMKLILSTQNKKTENLSLMSCTLDASAKIYGYRVDKVYSDMMKLMSGKVWSDDEADGTDGDDNADREDDDEENVPKKKKKLDKKDSNNSNFEKMLWSEARLDKSEAETESAGFINYGRNPLPSSAQFFLECPLSDADGLLSINCPLFNSSDKLFSSSDAILENFAARFEGSFDNVDFGKSIPGYCDIFEDESEECLVVNENLVYDKDSHLMPDSIHHNASLGGGDNMEPCDEPMVDYDDCLSDDDIGAEPTPLISQNSSRVTVPKASFSVNSMSKLVTARQSEYSFFDESRLNFMAGPAHWAIKNKKKITQKAPTVARAVKKEGKVNFNVNQVKMLRKLLFPKSACQLSDKTRMSWLNTSHKAPLNVYDHKDIVRLFHDDWYYINKDFKFGLFGSCESTGTNNEINGELTPDDFTDCDDRGAADDFADDADRDDHFPADHDDRSPSPVNNLPASSQVNDTAIDLIPAPLKVNKINIKYAKVQKRINMKLLKSTIWDCLQFDNKESSIVENNHSDIENSCRSSEVKLSHIYKSLFGKLPEEEAAQLSFPIVFMATLHMANEKTLRLLGNKENTDVTISLDDQ